MVPGGPPGGFGRLRAGCTRSSTTRRIKGREGCSGEVLVLMASPARLSSLRKAALERVRRVWRGAEASSWFLGRD